MRGLRSTIALMLVLGGLLAYIYFVTWKKPDTDTETKSEQVFASFQPDTIDEIRVKSESGETTALKKENGAWQITAPLTARADEEEVSTLIRNLNSLLVHRVIDENPTDLKDYGLATPPIEVDFKASADTNYRKLIIGEKSPTGSDLFAKRNDEKRVFLIPAHLKTAFSRSAFELRNKTVLTFERDRVDGIELTADGKTLRIRKDGQAWKIATPVVAQADAGAVEGLVGRLQRMQMKSIVTNDVSSADLRKYGLDKPTVTVNLNTGSSRATFLVGSKTGDDTFYARDASKRSVVTVESALADELRKGTDEYRRKNLFELLEFTAKRLEITRGTEPVVFEVTMRQGDVPSKWRRVTPNPTEIDLNKFDGLLRKLSGLRAISFVNSTAKTGLDRPVMTVYARFGDNKEERVTFGKVDNAVYAARPGEPGAAKTDASEFDEVLKALDEVAK